MKKQFERMTIREAIETLMTDGCYECTYGCDSPYKCYNGACPVREAVVLAVAILNEQDEAGRIF